MLIFRRTILKLSENWDVIRGFNNDYYLINKCNGKWIEINPDQAKALTVLDGNRTAEEIVKMVFRDIREKGVNIHDELKATLGFFSKCSKLKALRKVSLI